MIKFECVFQHSSTISIGKSCVRFQMLRTRKTQELAKKSGQPAQCQLVACPLDITKLMSCKISSQFSTVDLAGIQGMSGDSQPIPRFDRNLQKERHLSQKLEQRRKLAAAVAV
mmetsp:Transcript_74973/g.201189  ORF Transcript_74973/g.201189 Transcript_74973/m.201189 type:complete len:113 (+) Transcript_74973:184-522(+)